MTDRLMDPDDMRPVYLRIADELRRDYKAGVQLPSVPKMAESWGVAKETVRSAIDVLRNEGLVVSWQGRGTFYRVRATTDDADEPGTPTDPAVLQRLDAIMNRLDTLEARITEIESARHR
jgi:DNA-binding FadR family transcriptional regulator